MSLWLTSLRHHHDTCTLTSTVLLLGGTPESVAITVMVMVSASSLSMAPLTNSCPLLGLMSTSPSPLATVHSGGEHGQARTEAALLPPASVKNRRRPGDVPGAVVVTSY